ncbi:MAG: hypothetical protein JO126_08775 [Alphaproteobacteria bacterium]|nr:hypothetical protein [Alphaproteobacteria bacterium]
MSFKKEGKVLPKIFLAAHERHVAAIISSAMRKDFQNIKIAATAMAPQVEINIETLKKWYNGTNIPSGSNLILLARISPSVREAVFVMINNSDTTGQDTNPMEHPI